jgi:hypothetical protein
MLPSRDPLAVVREGGGRVHGSDVFSFFFYVVENMGVLEDNAWTIGNFVE